MAVPARRQAGCVGTTRRNYCPVSSLVAICLRSSQNPGSGIMDDGVGWPPPHPKRQPHSPLGRSSVSVTQLAWAPSTPPPLLSFLCSYIAIYQRRSLLPCTLFLRRSRTHQRLRRAGRPSSHGLRRRGGIRATTVCARQKQHAYARVPVRVWLWALHVVVGVRSCRTQRRACRYADVVQGTA